MNDRLQMKHALNAILVSAKKPQYENGVLVSEESISMARAALGDTGALVMFADKRLGCASCGAYADKITLTVDHTADCETPGVSR